MYIVSSLPSLYIIKEVKKIFNRLVIYLTIYDENFVDRASNISYLSKPNQVSPDF